MGQDIEVFRHGNFHSAKHLYKHSTALVFCTILERMYRAVKYCKVLNYKNLQKHEGDAVPVNAKKVYVEVKA